MNTALPDESPQRLTAYCPDFIWTGRSVLSDTALVVDDTTGCIQSLTPVSELSTDMPQCKLPNAFIMPGLVNTHTHSFQSLLKGVADDADFFTWRDTALYKFGATITPDELYTGALFAFSEMLLTGTTTVCDFFYIHNQSNENAQHIIRAAADLGIRFVLARTFYDGVHVPHAPASFKETPEAAQSNMAALLADYPVGNKTAMTSVLPAPHSLHGASKDMILAAAEIATVHQLPCHMHIAEGQYERQLTIEQAGKSPMQLLADWGVMNDRLVGIHCVWVDEADKALMAERDMQVSYNPSSNMFLGDGITPIVDYLQRGINITLGSDGGCSNNRASIIDEMRQCALLQKVAACDGTVIAAEDVLAMATVNAQRALGLDIGELTPGFAADFCVINRDDLSLQPRDFWQKHLVYAMQPSAIQAVYVHGRCVVQDGQIQTRHQNETVAAIERVWGAWRNRA